MGSDKRLSSLDKRTYLRSQYLRRTYNGTSPLNSTICQHSEHNEYVLLSETRTNHPILGSSFRSHNPNITMKQ